MEKLLKEKIPLSTKITNVVRRWQLSQEEIFKTVVASYIAQEGIPEDLVKAANQAAQELGYSLSFDSLDQLSTLDEENLLKAAKKRRTLLSRIDVATQHKILASLLGHIPHPPQKKAAYTQVYGKTFVTHLDFQTGRIDYQHTTDAQTPAISTQDNILPHARGTEEQTKLLDLDGNCLSGSCGDLSTKEHLLEQILFLLGIISGELYISDDHPTEEITILFASLLPWTELTQITREYNAIAALDQKTLSTPSRKIKLNLIYQNVLLGKLPTPAQTRTALAEINDEGLAHLMRELFPKDEALEGICVRLRTIHKLQSGDPTHLFFEKKKLLQEELELFSEIKKKHKKEPLLIHKGQRRLKQLDQFAKEKGFLFNTNRYRKG